jgi:transcriptional regulator with PAS, ATPase and Fis domain
MSEHAWVENFPGSITVCDKDGIMLEMNAAAEAMYAADGGRKLIGQNILDCHPARARALFCDMLAQQKTNVYTIEKRGQKKLIYQTPWYKDGEYAGFMEVSLVIPEEMPHFVRG